MIIGIVTVVAFLFVLRTCERTKKVEIKQKSTDGKSTFSVEVKNKKTDEKSNNE